MLAIPVMTLIVAWYFNEFGGPPLRPGRHAGQPTSTPSLTPRSRRRHICSSRAGSRSGTSCMRMMELGEMVPSRRRGRRRWRNRRFDQRRPQSSPLAENALCRRGKATKKILEI
jgi:hypothetical protein